MIVIEYKILKLNVDIINDWIDDGWQPWGAPFFGVTGATYQAIVKYEEDETPSDGDSPRPRPNQTGSLRDRSYRKCE